jgi:hypothetical protein
MASTGTRATTMTLRDAEIPGLIKQLDDEGMRQVAVERLANVSRKQLVTLHEALDGRAIGKDGQKALLEVLTTAHGRLRQVVPSDAELLERKHQQWIADYKRLAKHDKAWDDLAVEALTALGGGPGFGANATPKFKAAVDAGCPDPVIRYYYLTRSVAAETMSAAEALPQLDKVTREVEASGYPAMRKFYCYLRFAELAEGNGGGGIPPARLEEATKRALTLLPEMFKDPLPKATRDESIVTLARLLMARDKQLGAYQAMDKVLGAVAKSYSNPADYYYLKAYMYKDMAWANRGSGYASTVTPEGWKYFEEELDIAEQAARAGWREDPSLAGCATVMMTVCMGKGLERSEMEKWFRRAMLADPQNYDACWTKVQYLLPKWHGTEEEALAFGRECAKTGNGRVPRVLYVAYVALTALHKDDPDYWAHKGIESELLAAFAKIESDKTRLQTDREDFLLDRADYLGLAWNSGQHALCYKLMQEFGDDVNKASLGDGTYDQMHQSLWGMHDRNVLTDEKLDAVP